MSATRPRLAVVPSSSDDPEALTPSRASQFDATLAVHERALYRTARVLTRSDAAAEDLVQETAVKAWRAWGDLRQGAAAKAWLHRILHRTFLNTWRAAGRRPRVVDVDLDDLLRTEGFSDEPAWEPPNEEIGDEVVLALQALPEGFREAVWLVDVEGLALAEAAEALEIPPGSLDAEPSLVTTTNAAGGRTARASERGVGMLLWEKRGLVYALAGAADVARLEAFAKGKF